MESDETNTDLDHFLLSVARILLSAHEDGLPWFVFYHFHLGQLFNLFRIVVSSIRLHFFIVCRRQWCTGLSIFPFFKVVPRFRFFYRFLGSLLFIFFSLLAWVFALSSSCIQTKGFTLVFYLFEDRPKGTYMQCLFVYCYFCISLSVDFSYFVLPSSCRNPPLPHFSRLFH